MTQRGMPSPTVSTWLACLALSSPGQDAEPPAGPRADEWLAVRAAGLVDVRSGVLVRDAVLLVRGERIEAVGAAGAVAVPAGARSIDLGELVLVPGLIDAHVHLAWGPGEPGQPLSGSAEARATLAAGFTSVRSLGSTGRADLALQRAIEAGLLAGPRMQVALSGIGPAGGICDRVFAGEARAATAEEGAERVRELAAAGAQVIKVCAGGGVLPAEGERGACECDAALLARVVAEAHALGLPVAAHAQGPASIQRALSAGVDSIEHGGLADEAAVAGLAASGAYLVPTLARLDALVEAAERDGAPSARRAELRAARELAFESAAAAVAGGARIAFGTDAGVLPHGDNAREFRALAEIGLPPLEALRAATIRAAELFGWADRVGALEPGLQADVVAVRGNPLEEPGALERVEFVMKGGVVYRGPDARR